MATPVAPVPPVPDLGCSFFWIFFNKIVPKLRENDWTKTGVLRGGFGWFMFHFACYIPFVVFWERDVWEKGKPLGKAGKRWTLIQMPLMSCSLPRGPKPWRLPWNTIQGLREVHSCWGYIYIYGFLRCFYINSLSGCMKFVSKSGWHFRNQLRSFGEFSIRKPRPLATLVVLWSLILCRGFWVVHP